MTTAFNVKQMKALNKAYTRWKKNVQKDYKILDNTGLEDYFFTNIIGECVDTAIMMDRSGGSFLDEVYGKNVMKFVKSRWDDEDEE